MHPPSPAVGFLLIGVLAPELNRYEASGPSERTLDHRQCFRSQQRLSPVSHRSGPPRRTLHSAAAQRQPHPSHLTPGTPGTRRHTPAAHTHHRTPPHSRPPRHRERTDPRTAGRRSTDAPPLPDSPPRPPLTSQLPGRQRQTPVRAAASARPARSSTPQQRPQQRGVRAPPGAGSRGAAGKREGGHGPKEGRPGPGRTAAGRGCRIVLRRRPRPVGEWCAGADDGAAAGENGGTPDDSPPRDRRADGRGCSGCRAAVPGDSAGVGRSPGGRRTPQ